MSRQPVRVKITLACLTLMLLTAGNSFAQRAIGKKPQREELQEIRAEIKRYHQKLAKEEKKELSALDLIAQLDREIYLLRKLIRALKKTELKKRKQIKEINKELINIDENLKELKEAFAKRVVYFYKHGRIRDIEILFSSKSLNQAYVWLKYRRIIAANDRRNYNDILKKKTKIARMKEKLQQQLLESRKILKEKNREEKKLKRKRKERNKILARIRANKELYRMKLKEYKKAAEEISRLIAEGEKNRLAKLKGRVETTTFPKLKGKMIWPTRGKIISKFGKQRDPQLNTVTENLGVDIKAAFGEAVRAVGKGIVTAITWQRGRGNILILSHHGGYYTVYAHLAEILVGVGERVEQGQVIGRVGEMGSLEGPVLHFEIWKYTQNYDPEQWLQ